MTATQVVVLTMLSGLASVDRLAGLNVMLSRPFVVAGIIGYLFNNIEMCLMIGIIFEFLGMLEVPVGTTVASDDTFAGYAAALLASTGAVSANAISILFCISITLVFMYPVTLTDKYCRYLNRRLIITSALSKKSDYESSLISYGLLVAFLRGAVVYNVAVAIIWGMLQYIDKIHMTEYAPYLSIVLITAFLGGYLVRFFSVDNIFKAGLLVSGVAFGWWLL